MVVEDKDQAVFATLFENFNFWEKAINTKNYNYNRIPHKG
jgi:hypothetical protein